MNQNLQSESTFGKRLGRALIKIFRVVMVLALIAGVAALIYYGTPYVYQKFIQPVEANSARIAELESQQTSEIDTLKSQLGSLQTRLSAAESGITGDSQKMAKLEGEFLAVNDQLSEQSEKLTQLQDLQQGLKDLETMIKEQESAQADLSTEIAKLERELNSTRAAEYLSRARVYLLQSNFGLARQDVQVAYTLLLAKSEASVGEDAVFLQKVLDRLVMVNNNLPDYPVVAATDLEIAWKALVTGEMDLQPEMPEMDETTLTPMPVLTDMSSEQTATETPSPMESPTPNATP